METVQQHDVFTSAIEQFATTSHSYAIGFSNHGPMAVEALVSMGQAASIPDFMTAYLPRLEPGHPVAPANEPWQGWLHPHLEDLVGVAGRHAGHGLLRVAHAVRALHRSAPSGVIDRVLLQELALGVDYWQLGNKALAAPDQLRGHVPAGEWADSIVRLPASERMEGVLTRTLSAAAAQPGFVDHVASLGAATDPADTLDAIALEAVRYYLSNRGIAAFALLHGVTVSTMARELVPLLDVQSARRLEGSVAAFAAAAISGFDDPVDAQPEDAHPVESTLLGAAAARTLDDHTIKFADATLGLATRTGSELPLLALRRRIEETHR